VHPHKSFRGRPASRALALPGTLADCLTFCLREKLKARRCPAVAAVSTTVWFGDGSTFMGPCAAPAPGRIANIEIRPPETIGFCPIK